MRRRLRPVRLRQVLSETFAAEGERCLLWVPVLVGAGIGAYFTLPEEPSARVLAGAGLAAAALGAAAVRAARLRPVLLSLALALLGLVAAGLRTASVDGPQLHQRVGPTYLSGRVIDIDRHARGYRLVLDRVRIVGVRPSDAPRRIRVTVPAGDGPPEAGTIVGMRGVLMPLPAPSLPDGFDFQRWAFFQQIGAVGYSYGAPRLRLDRRDDWTAWVAAIRAEVDRRLERAYADDGEVAPVRSAVAIALVTGRRGGIPEEVNDAMRAAGLAHVLAISGHHVAVVAGFVFLLVRLGLALVPWIALRWPTKKIAALVAFAAALAYLFLSGASVPTQRAVLMLGVVTLAALLDRFALSMRVAAVAATAILLLTPEMLVGPSFQLSFAAAVALIAAYEAWRERRARTGTRGREEASRLVRAGRRVAAFLLAILATSAIASIATAPFAAYHFQRLPLYGLVGNMLAMPVVSLWIMPLVLLTLVLLPLGLEGIALAPLGWGIDLFVAIAREVASWPHAVVPAGGLGVVGLSLITIGGLWTVIWRRRWRWAGIPLVLAAAVPWALGPPLPDVLIGNGGRLVGFHQPGETLWISSGRTRQFVADLWRQHLGVDEVRRFPRAGAREGRASLPISCRAEGCSWLRDGRRVVWLRRPPTDAADRGSVCRADDVIIVGTGAAAAVRDALGCPDRTLVIDRAAIDRAGALTIRLVGPGVVIDTAAEARGARPWVVNTVAGARPGGPARRPGRRGSAGSGRRGSRPRAGLARPPNGSA